MKNSLGFSLIEVVVAIGIFSLLISSAFLIGLPEDNRYIISSERNYLVDALLESRTRSYVSGTLFTVSTWSNGYCIKDVSGMCIVPAHNLPSNIVLTSISLATSTQMVLSFTDSNPQNILQTEINIDQNGFIDGK